MTNPQLSSGTLPSVALLFCVLLVSPSHAIRFIIDSSGRAGNEKCLGDDLSENVVIMGEFSISTMPGTFDDRTDVLFWIQDPTSKVILSKAETKAQFALTTETPGEYKFCVRVRPRRGYIPPAGYQREVEMSVRAGVETFDFENIARKENLDELGITLRKMEETVSEITREMQHLRNREERLWHTNESTSMRLTWLSVLSLLVAAGATAWQVTYLKTYFQKRKLI